MSEGAKSCIPEAIDVYKNALASINADYLVEAAIKVTDNALIVQPKNGEIATIRPISVDLSDKNLHVIGCGKSVIPMALGLARYIKGDVSCSTSGVLSAPIGLRHLLDDKTKRELLNAMHIKCMWGSQDNLPDNDSVFASESILSYVKSSCDSDLQTGKKPLFVMLISGGGSACLTSPRFITLAQKLDLIRKLVQRGANIVELNKVRRFFSRVKGGQLARYILDQHPRATVVSLILSDVIGDPIEYIASGPTYIENESNHMEDMLTVLAKYDIKADDYTKSVDSTQLHQTTSYNTSRIHNHIIGNNAMCVKSAVERARFLGFDVLQLGSSLQGPIEKVYERIIVDFNEFCRQKRGSNKLAVIGGGEATVMKMPTQTWGKGGRAQELALVYLLSENRMFAHTKEIEYTDCFLAGSTDGQDGPTDVAAAIASCSEWADEHKFGPLGFADECLDARNSHDSYNFWTRFKPEWLIKTGLTGTNVMDLYMCFRERR